MKVKITHKEKPGEKDWSLTENVERIELTLRSGVKAILTQKKEGEFSRLKVKSKKKS